MRVQLLVTKTDFCLPNLLQEFKDLGINYDVEYVEEHPELVSAYKIRHSPNILVDGKLVYQRQPSVPELKSFFDKLI